MKSYARFTLAELIQATHAQWLNETSASSLQPNQPCAVNTDTRTLDTECAFVALVGERFDGHGFVPQAVEAGAPVVIVNAPAWAAHPEWHTLPVPVLGVDDTQLAYLRLGLFHRQRSKAKIIAITGSSGKTTCKEMLAQLLGSVGKTQKTQKNFNNEIGVPHTLLSLEADTQFMVVEQGMRGLGQIELLTRHTQPDVTLISSIGPAHIGLLGSLEAIAQAKCEIMLGLDPKTGIAVLNVDAPYLIETAKKTAQHVWPGSDVDFIQHTKCYCMRDLKDEKVDPATGHVRFSVYGNYFELGLPGQHNLANMVGCLKVCEALGLSLSQFEHTLSQFEPGGDRWQWQTLRETPALTVINDAYNANPDSMKASYETFRKLESAQYTQKIAVIGWMNELGDLADAYHQELGQWLSSRLDGITGVMLVGQLAKITYNELSKANDSCPIWFADTPEDAAHTLQEHCNQPTLMWLKASRSAKLEDCVTQLTQWLESHATSCP